MDVLKQENDVQKQEIWSFFLKNFNSFCPGTFALTLVPGQRDTETGFFFVLGERDTGTGFFFLSRDKGTTRYPVPVCWQNLYKNWFFKKKKEKKIG